jgi:hypothetical protein
MRRSSPKRRHVAGIALALGLLTLAALASPAGALTARFTLNDGAAYSRLLSVKAGDGGYTPFFRPAVVVWDGGSIIAGHRADPGFEFPVQTLAVVPHVCVSHVSSTGGARIADMLADAPLEVDAWYRAEADLDLCVVLAGGGDFRKGLTAAEVYQSLRTYCLQRRAAGFHVVVLSVLPCSGPVTFEASRLAFNALLRDTWPQFADGLADIASDPRIGDTGDNLDQQFYMPDALHPGNAGYSVMAAVTAPVLNEQPWRSSRCEIHLREAGGEWGDWRPYAAATTLELPEGEGPRLVEAEYRIDGGAPVAVADSIFVDTVPPSPVALGNVRARRGATVRLPFRIDDAQPCGPTCTATVRVTTSSGRVLRTFVRRLLPVGRATSVAVGGLGRGRYRYVVTARDSAGNPETVPGSARLTVR